MKCEGELAFRALISRPSQMGSQPLPVNRYRGMRPVYGWAEIRRMTVSG